MIIERFRPGKSKAIYQRFAEKGRMLPEGVVYLNSWVESDLKTCYQVMESESFNLLQEWISQWADLCEFDVRPVLTSAEASKRAAETES